MVRDTAQQLKLFCTARCTLPATYGAYGVFHAIYIPVKLPRQLRFHGSSTPVGDIARIVDQDGYPLITDKGDKLFLMKDALVMVHMPYVAALRATCHCHQRILPERNLQIQILPANALHLCHAHGQHVVCQVLKCIASHAHVNGLVR